MTEGLFLDDVNKMFLKVTFESPEQVGIDLTGRPAICKWKGEQNAIWVLNQDVIKEDAPLIPDRYSDLLGEVGLRGPLFFTNVDPTKNLEFKVADNPELAKILAE